MKINEAIKAHNIGIIKLNNSSEMSAQASGCPEKCDDCPSRKWCTRKMRQAERLGHLTGCIMIAINRPHRGKVARDLERAAKVVLQDGMYFDHQAGIRCYDQP